MYKIRAACYKYVISSYQGQNVKTSVIHIGEAWDTIHTRITEVIILEIF